MNVKVSTVGPDGPSQAYPAEIFSNPFVERLTHSPMFTSLGG